MADNVDTVVGDTENKRGKRKPVSAEDIRTAAQDAMRKLTDIQAALTKAIESLRGTVIHAKDANFSVRDDLTALIKELDDTNVKQVVTEVQKVVKARLIARASE